MPPADFKTKGSFADVVLPALLVQAMNARFTGMFRAERESIIKVIYFKEGDIAFASSNQPSDRLGFFRDVRVSIDVHRQPNVGMTHVRERCIGGVLTLPRSSAGC